MARQASGKARRIPRQARARASVAAILEAAAQILERDGHAGFTTNAVALRAGVSIGSLYQYFPDKAAILAALVERAADARLGGLADLADSLRHSPPGAMADALVDAAVAGELARPRLARLLDAEEARLEAERPAGATGLDALIADLLGPALPQLPAAARAELARSLRVGVRAVIDDALNRPDPDPDLARRSARRVARGLLWAAGARGIGGSD